MSAASFNGPPNRTFCLQPVGAVCEQSTCVPSGKVTITPCGEHKMLAPNLISKSLPSRGTGAFEEYRNECVRLWFTTWTVNYYYYYFFFFFFCQCSNPPEKPMTPTVLSLRSLSVIVPLVTVEYVVPVFTRALSGLLSTTISMRGSAIPLTVVLCGPLQQSPASPSGPHVGCIGACRLAGDGCCCPEYREVYGLLPRPPGPPLWGPHPPAGGPVNWPPLCCEGQSAFQCSLLPHTKQTPLCWPPPLPRPPLKPIFPPSCPLLPPQLPPCCPVGWLVSPWSYPKYGGMTDGVSGSFTDCWDICLVFFGPLFLAWSNCNLSSWFSVFSCSFCYGGCNFPVYIHSAFNYYSETFPSLIFTFYNTSLSAFLISFMHTSFLF